MVGEHHVMQGNADVVAEDALVIQFPAEQHIRHRYERLAAIQTKFRMLHPARFNTFR